ncbi:MAG: hypothetical protein SNJ71_05460, partial [Bacteroidales bacterium]
HGFDQCAKDRTESFHISLDLSQFVGIQYDRGKNNDMAKKITAYLELKYAGYRSANGTFAQIGEVDVFWTSSVGRDPDGREYVWIRYIDNIEHKGIIRKKHYDKSAFGVRCFKD